MASHKNWCVIKTVAIFCGDFGVPAKERAENFVRQQRNPKRFGVRPEGQCPEFVLANPYAACPKVKP